MTSQQAAAVVAVLNAGFPRESMEPASIALYVSEIALLVDGQAGIEAARLTVRQAERFPTIKEFRQTYRSVAEARRAEVPALPEEPRFTVVPEWVSVWFWARRVKGEKRMFPQQDEHGMVPSVSLADYERLRDEWAAAGSPSVKSVRQIIDAMAGATG